MTAAGPLPDDPATLREMLRERERVIATQAATLVERERIIVEQAAALEQVKREAAARIDQLQRRHAAEIEALWRRLRGVRRERFDPAQLLLFGLTVTDLGQVVDTAAQAAARNVGGAKTPPRRHDHGRGPLPAHLPREIVTHDLTEAEQKCPCCGQLRQCIGEVRTEQLEVVPLQLKVLVHVQRKYACADCEAQAHPPQIELAPKPPAPIARGLPGPVLLALIIVSKFADHVPLYRLEGMFTRAGVDLGRNTMCRWLLGVGMLVQGLVDLMAQRIRQGRSIATDETRLPVQAKPERGPPTGPAPPATRALPPPVTPTAAPPPGPSSPAGAAAPADADGPMLSEAQTLLLGPALAATPAAAPTVVQSVLPEMARRCPAGRMWVYLGDDTHPYTVFIYTPDRSRAGPEQFLAGYRGYLQADAYGGYDGIYAPGAIVEVACWAHARRKFYEAQTSDARRSAQMLALIGELYAVERQAQRRVADLLAARPEATLEEQDEVVRALRQARSVPVLARIAQWLEREGKLVLERSPIALAINYVRNQWAALNVYTTQGYLSIDNNAAEREMKKIATGRKNWLFAGTEAGARASANLYSLVVSARRHGLDPLVYLADVLARLPGLPISQLPTLLPDAWKQVRAAAATSSALTAGPARLADPDRTEAPAAVSPASPPPRPAPAAPPAAPGASA